MSKFILFEEEKPSYDSMNWAKTDWETIYSQISNDPDREKLIDGFINSFLASKNIPEIKFRNALKSYLSSAAPTSLNKNNPFLLWINLYNQKVRAITDIDDDDFNSLINLHGNQIILDEDLSGTADIGTKSVIFNSELFKYSDSDIKYLTQVFYWLDQKDNATRITKDINKLDIDTMKQDSNVNKHVLNSFLYGGDRHTTDDVRNIKYVFVFRAQRYSPTGQLRKPFEIKSMIDYIESHARQDIGEEERYKEEQREEEKQLSTKLAKELNKETAKVRDTVKYLKGIGKITANTTYQNIKDYVANTMDQQGI